MKKLKNCHRCHQQFPRTAEFFYRNKSRGDGLDMICKQCSHKKHKPYRWKNYGLSRAMLADMYEKQRSGCAICGVAEDKFPCRLSIDHCHKTNKVRGLLCHNCNHLLGNAKDNIDILHKAIQYLKSGGF